MITLATDSNNDLYLSNLKSIETSSDIYAIEQVINHKVKTVLGELIFNTDEGIPYFDYIWSGVPNVQQAEFYIREAILAVDGVTGIESFSIFVQNKILSYNATINTIYGSVTSGL